MTEYQTELEKLQNEIVQLKTDKDFVWGLWKRLQLSSPDLVEAVSLITKREKEKIAKELCELQETIRLKDESLNSLQQAIDTKNAELAALARSNKETVARAIALEKHCAEVTKHASKLDHVLDGLEERDGHRQIIDEYECERRALIETVSKLQTQLRSALEDRADFQLLAVKRQQDSHWQDETQELARQLEESRGHIRTQQDTIEVLRDLLERTLARSRSHHHGYSSDGDGNGGAVHHFSGSRASNTRANDDLALTRVDSPIEDLNYKVDRLQVHMQQLQDCLPTRVKRSKSSPARARSAAPATGTELAQCQRRLQLLQARLARTEKSLCEEKASGSAGQQLLEKANARARTLLATVKQLRGQGEQARVLESDLRGAQDLLQAELDAARRQLRALQTQLDQAGQNSLQDAARIQDLLACLEAARTDVAVQALRRSEQADKEIDGLKDLVKQLENDKCTLEMRCSSASAAASASPLPSLRRRQWLPALREKRHQCRMSRKRRNKPGVRNGRPQGTSEDGGKTRQMCAILEQLVASEDGAGTGDNHNEYRLPAGGDQGEDETLGGVSSESEDADSAAERSWTRSSLTPITTPTTTRQAAGGPGRGHGGVHARRAASALQEASEGREKRLERDLKECRQRVAALQQQLRSVSEARDSLRSKGEAAQTQLRQAQADLVQARARCCRLEEALRGGSCTDHAGGGGGGLDRCRELQQELRCALQELEQTRDRAARLERDSGCKKRVIEDLRTRLASIDVAKEKDKIDNEQSGRRVRELEDANWRLKTQLESVQTRVSVLLEERRRCGQESAQLLGKLDTAEQRLAELRQGKQAAESRLAALGQRHDSRVSEIVSCSDSALEQAARQIHELQNRSRRYERLIVTLATEFHRKVREIRRLLEFGGRSGKLSGCSREPSKSDSLIMPVNSPGIEFAKSMAADILNMSTGEIDSLLSGRTESVCADENRQINTNNSVDASDKACKKGGPEFVQRVKHAMQHEVSFEQAVRELFLDQLEQLIDMMAPDSGLDSLS